MRAVILAAAMIGCHGSSDASSQTLTRETALELLKPHAKPLLVSVYTVVNVPCADRATMDDATGLSGRWDQLIARGIVTTRDTVFGPRGEYRYCTLRMTPQVNPAAAATWKKQPDPVDAHFFTYEIPEAQLVPTAVTGIAQGAPSKDGTPDARVEFAWKWAPTPMTDYFRWPRGHPTNTGTGIALMRRYDDGWRVVTVSYGSADVL